MPEATTSTAPKAPVKTIEFKSPIGGVLVLQQEEVKHPKSKKKGSKFFTLPMKMRNASIEDYLKIWPEKPLVDFIWRKIRRIAYKLNWASVDDTGTFDEDKFGKFLLGLSARGESLSSLMDQMSAIQIQLEQLSDNEPVITPTGDELADLRAEKKANEEYKHQINELVGQLKELRAVYDAKQAEGESDDDDQD